MSSAEKMKIELAKVREEFKMSESDCGSARVQGKFKPYKGSFCPDQCLSSAINTRLISSVSHR